MTAQKQNEIKDSYSTSGSRYQEEAYASGDGVILNISSIPSNGMSTENVISQYLTDSSAENVSAGENVKLAGNNYATSTATINQTQTKTYGTGVDGQVLLITLYFTDTGTVDSFEGKIFFQLLKILSGKQKPGPWKVNTQLLHLTDIPL